MKVNGNTIKPGNVIEHKNELWVATKTSHVKPGKGGAFAQIELRNLKDGTKFFGTILILQLNYII